VSVSELLEGLFGCPAQSAKWRYHTVIQGGQRRYTEIHVSSDATTMRKQTLTGSLRKEVRAKSDRGIWRGSCVLSSSCQAFQKCAKHTLSSYKGYKNKAMTETRFSTQEEAGPCPCFILPPPRLSLLTC
jgi:hypothetical protein